MFTLILVVLALLDPFYMFFGGFKWFLTNRLQVFFVCLLIFCLFVLVLACFEMVLALLCTFYIVFGGFEGFSALLDPFYMILLVFAGFRGFFGPTTSSYSSSRWLTQLILPNSSTTLTQGILPDIDLKFSVVVAESHPRITKSWSSDEEVVSTDQWWMQFLLTR